MKGPVGTGMARLLLFLLVLGTGFVLLAGCTGTAPSTEQGSLQTVTTPAGVPPYMVHIAGTDRGVIILVGRSTCPWCLRTKALLENMSVGYYWVDLGTLNEAETNDVMASIASVKGCEKVSSVPILVIRGEKCIIGYQEESIREAIG